MKSISNDILKKSQAQIGARNRRAGKEFERKVAKIIASHFGWNWKEAFDRAGAGHEQSHDALTLSKYSFVWPFWWECKYRQDWSFPQMFKSPETSMVYRWLDEAITYTAEENLNPALAFSKPHQPIYWMSNVVPYNPTTMLSMATPRGVFFVCRLEDYLKGWDK